MASLFSGLIQKLRGARDGELPIRDELYSIERLEQYATTLAAEHKVAEKPRHANLLLPRLEENSRALVAAYHALAESIRREHVISPPAEGLLQHFQVREDQIRESRQ